MRSSPAAVTLSLVKNMVQSTPSVNVDTVAETTGTVDILPIIQAWAAWFVASANPRGNVAGKIGMNFETSGGQTATDQLPAQTGACSRESALIVPTGHPKNRAASSWLKPWRSQSTMGA